MSIDGNLQRRRRGTQLEHALLDAAWDELVEHGWSAFSMPRVAQRAGAGKASLYARWPTKAALVSATSHRHSQLLPGPLDLSGTLAENLRVALDGACAFLRGPFGSVARGLASEADKLEESQRPENAAVRVAVEIVNRAQELGELGSAPVPPRVLNIGFDLVTAQFLFGGEPPGPEDLDEIVDKVWVPALRAATAS